MDFLNFLKRKFTLKTTQEHLQIDPDQTKWLFVFFELIKDKLPDFLPKSLVLFGKDKQWVLHSVQVTKILKCIKCFDNSVDVKWRLILLEITKYLIGLSQSRVKTSVDKLSILINSALNLYKQAKKTLKIHRMAIDDLI